jgi:hypothetical protein
VLRLGGNWQILDCFWDPLLDRLLDRLRDRLRDPLEDWLRRNKLSGLGMQGDAGRRLGSSGRWDFRVIIRGRGGFGRGLEGFVLNILFRNDELVFRLRFCVFARWLNNCELACVLIAE